jgi:hypothetical protein
MPLDVVVSMESRGVVERRIENSGKGTGRDSGKGAELWIHCYIELGLDVVAVTSIQYIYIASQS